MKNNKGITLIALVVTIIVLLILAGVSIAMLTGDNGILSNATKGAAQTKLTNTVDEISLKVSENVASYLNSIYVEGKDKSELDTKSTEQAIFNALQSSVKNGITIEYTSEDRSKSETIDKNSVFTENSLYGSTVKVSVSEGYYVTAKLPDNENQTTLTWSTIKK